MTIQSIFRSLDYCFLISTSILLALGSIGVYREVFILLGAINALAALGYKLIHKGRVEIPKTFFLYILFLTILLIHTQIMGGKFIFFWLFLSGGLVWIEVYNFKNLFAQYFNSILIIMGLLMGVLYFYSLSFPVILPNLVSLFSAPTSLIKHSNIGDLWAVILTSVFFLLSRKRSIFYIPIFIIGVYFLAISYSRSALVSLAVGVLYIFQKSESQKLFRKFFIFSLLGVVILIIYSSMSKTVLLSRPYFLQAIIGFAQYPLGTGMGNFSYVSSASNLVHNIVLEVFSGMGIFSIVFIVWLYKVLRSLFTSHNISIEAVAIFLVVLIDFCFNTTYTIPAFVWIWFFALGLIQQPKNEE